MAMSGQFTAWKGKGELLILNIVKSAKKMKNKKKKLIPFDLERAKAGDPVITGDGKDVRIICFDRNSEKFPIVVLKEDGSVMFITEKGHFSQIKGEIIRDLFMKPKKKPKTNRVGWINIYPNNVGDLHASKEAAEYVCQSSASVIASIKVKWYDPNYKKQ